MIDPGGPKMADARPTARQRELSRRLRALREAKGLTAAQVAETLSFSLVKISRIETAKHGASLRDVRSLCQLYEVPEAEKAQLMEMAREAREPGWWAQYDDLGNANAYLALEQGARAVTYYSLTFIHGLLQTEGYARSIIRSINPLMDDQVLKERVQARIRRQELLDSPERPQLAVFLDEAALRRTTGGHAVMAAQLAKILDVTAAEEAVVQVVPFSSEVTASSDSNFTLFEFTDPSLSSIVHIESLLTSLILDRAAIVDRYREVLDLIRDAALSPRESQVLIAEIRDAHQGHS
jgi:transcriptional regulator with XRE-family HTH domain